MTRCILMLGVLCAPLLSLPAFGQADFSNIVGHEKRPPQDNVQTAKPLPPAEAKKLEGKLHQIRDLILATPALKNLRGYDWATFTTVKDHVDASHPVVASVTYVVFPYSKDPSSGKPVSAEEGPPLTIHINDPEAILGQGAFRMDPEARFSAEPPSSGQPKGFPIFAGQFVVMSKRNQPVFLPVSQERYLKRLVERARAELNAMNARFKDVPEDPAATKREVEARQAVLNTIRAQQEKRWADMQSTSPDRVAAERAQFDVAEKKALEEIEEFKNSTPRQRYLKHDEDKLKALEAELAGLSPAQRSATAYIPRTSNRDRASGLAPQGVTDGTRIVTINPALFDPKKPKSAIQLIILGTTMYNPRLFDQVQQQLDKTALMKLIE